MRVLPIGESTMDDSSIYIIRGITMGKTVLDRKASEKILNESDSKLVKKGDTVEQVIGTKIPDNISKEGIIEPDKIILSDDVKKQLKLDKKELSQKMKDINEKLGIKPSAGWKYHLPKTPRTGKYQQVISMRDSRVCLENLFYRMDPDLFETYLAIQKNNMDLDTWKMKFELTDDQMKIAHQFITPECIQKYKDMPSAKEYKG